jgi:hypothetical protein
MLALAAAALTAAFFCVSIQAQVVQSGQRVHGQNEIEPGFDDSTGNVIYLKTPLNAPLPTHTSPEATAPFFEFVYPLASTLPANEFDCQPSNCNHVNVLPFPDPAYGVLPGSDKACTDFNSGQPCSPSKGHDHLVGIASTGGDFNVAWHVWLVVFTPSGFADGAINTRVTTLKQLNALVDSGDAQFIDTGFTFHCSVTSEQTYDIGTPLVIQFP